MVLTRTEITQYNTIISCGEIFNKFLDCNTTPPQKKNKT